MNEYRGYKNQGMLMPGEGLIHAAVPIEHVTQSTEWTCGPACVRSLLLSLGRPAPSEAQLLMST